MYCNVSRGGGCVKVFDCLYIMYHVSCKNIINPLTPECLNAMIESGLRVVTYKGGEGANHSRRAR